MNFAEKLIELRTRRKISREILANEIGVSPSIVRYWEDGKKLPRLDSFILLAKFFNVSLDELAGLKD